MINIRVTFSWDCSQTDSENVAKFNVDVVTVADDLLSIVYTIDTVIILIARFPPFFLLKIMEITTFTKLNIYSWIQFNRILVTIVTVLKY